MCLCFEPIVLRLLEVCKWNLIWKFWREHLNFNISFRTISIYANKNLQKQIKKQQCLKVTTLIPYMHFHCEIKKKLRNGICVLKRFVSRNLNTKSLKLYSVMLVLHAPTHMQNKADNKHAKPIRYHSALSIRE